VLLGVQVIVARRAFDVAFTTDHFDNLAMHSASSSADELSPRLLLCDDSPVERLALAHFLRSSGYAVDEAGDGESALQHLKHRSIDLVLLDIQMPGGSDGFDVLNYVREHRRALPVILLSGLQPDQIQDKMRDLDRPELPPLFIKPIDVDQLLQVIEMQLRGELPEFPEHQPDPEDEPEPQASDHRVP
jgi:CheY-like chemotaxis protein